MSTDLIAEALAFAFKAHAGQKRKYDGQDYIQHPVRVALRVQSGNNPPPVVAAALLHDVVEDCGVSLATIREAFGEDVARVVGDLTDQFTKSAYPAMNRKARKEREADRLSRMEWHSKAVKLADIADNLRSMDPADGFARVFLEEKRDLLSRMGWRGVGLESYLRDVDEAAAALAEHLPAAERGENTEARS